jgi:RimJ/RimL family protein N-acetyltransferase
MPRFALAAGRETQFTPATLGETLLAILKEGTPRGDPALTLPVKNSEGLRLRPVATMPERVDPDDVQCLTELRNRHPRAFLTEFEATPERKTKWLTKYVRQDRGRILFMVENTARERLGYIGLAFIDWDAKSGEADAIVSGGSSPRGAMKYSLLTLLLWAQGQLGLESLSVRVLADNPAVNFYRRLGFVETGVTPLVRVPNADGCAWVEGRESSKAERDLLNMQWNASGYTS